jgi:hypothetical protein
MRALCIRSHSCQHGVERDSGKNEHRNQPDGNNPTNRKVSLQEMLTVSAAVLAVNVDSADYRKQDAAKRSEAIPDVADRLRDVGNGRGTT